MKNGNGIILGGGAAGATLPVTGPEHVWLAGLAFLLVVGGFALARWAGARRQA